MCAFVCVPFVLAHAYRAGADHYSTCLQGGTVWTDRTSAVKENPGMQIAHTRSGDNPQSETEEIAARVYNHLTVHDGNHNAAFRAFGQWMRLSPDTVRRVRSLSESKLIIRRAVTFATANIE